MIRIILNFTDSGLLESLSSRGHAHKTGKLPSEACAGVSVLLRTAARLTSHSDGLVVDGKADKPGHLDLRIRHVSPGRLEWFKGAMDMVILGLQDLSREYPGSIQIRTNVRKG